ARAHVDPAGEERMRERLLGRAHEILVAHDVGRWPPRSGPGLDVAAPTEELLSRLDVAPARVARKGVVRARQAMDRVVEVAAEVERERHGDVARIPDEIDRSSSCRTRKGDPTVR